MKLPKAIGAALLAFLAAVVPAFAQTTWPGKPIKLVNGYPAGGGADILARMVAERLSAALGQPMVVENRTGATGMIAAQSVAAAAPDGYTLLLYTMNMACTSPLMPGNKVPLDPDRDLAPIVIIAGLDNLLYVTPSRPWRTVAEVIAAAKAEPGKLTYGSSGIGGSYHLWAAQFTQLAGIEMLHVPFRGGPPAIAEVVAGRVDMMFGNLAEILPHIRSGAVRAIAFTSVPPSPVLPGVPTIAETLPGFKSTTWNGLLAPAGTPQPVINAMAAEMAKAFKDPVFLDKLARLGLDPVPGSPQEFGDSIRGDYAMWRDVIKSVGLTIE